MFLASLPAKRRGADRERVVRTSWSGIDYQRITLINLRAEERLTIDLEIGAQATHDGVGRRFGPLTIVEVKQAPLVTARVRCERPALT